MSYTPRRHAAHARRDIARLARDLASGEAAHKRPKDAAATLGDLADLTDALPRALAGIAVELQLLGGDTGAAAAIAINQAVGTLTQTAAQLHAAHRQAVQPR